MHHQLYNNNFIYLTILATDNCKEGDIRLVNGTVEGEGRLEVCASGVWGTVCASRYGYYYTNNKFKQSSAIVACKQLGYTNTAGIFISYYSSIIIYYVGAIIDTSDKFGVGNGPIVYSNVDCVGNEKRLSHCNRHQQSDHQVCRYAGIVGLKCLESNLAIYLYIMSNMLIRL